MTFRRFDPDRDTEAVRRIFLEVGWVDKDHLERVDANMAAGNAWVADVHDQAESAIYTAGGSLRYMDRDLPLSYVASVTTSRVGRKQGLALGLTARGLAHDVANGAVVGVLGMFDQGFYNRLGFGTGGYEIWVRLDPAQLNVPSITRAPHRITGSDWREAHAARMKRLRRHGCCNMDPSGITRVQMQWRDSAFGLGFHDGDELSHYFWCVPENVGGGPYRIKWMVYHNAEQLIELLSVIKSLGDQVRSVEICEPPGMHLQDFIAQPFRFSQLTEGTRHPAQFKAFAHWQIRMLDVPACVAARSLYGPEVRFNLELTDPIGPFLDDDCDWRGVGGQYVVSVGRESSAERGSDASLPTLAASVGAFSRMWLGVRPATGLAVSDDLSGPAELLAELDRAFCLPQPRPDWEL